MQQWQLWRFHPCLSQGGCPPSPPCQDREQHPQLTSIVPLLGSVQSKSSAAKSSGQGLKLPQWGSDSLQGSPPQHRNSWEAQHPASIAHWCTPDNALHSSGSSPDKQVFWLGTLKRKQAMTDEKKTPPTLPITEVSFKTLVCCILINARSIYLHCHFQVFSPSCTELVCKVWLMAPRMLLCSHCAQGLAPTHANRCTQQGAHSSAATPTLKGTFPPCRVGITWEHVFPLPFFYSLMFLPQGFEGAGENHSPYAGKCGNHPKESSTQGAKIPALHPSPMWETQHSFESKSMFSTPIAMGRTAQKQVV